MRYQYGPMAAVALLRFALAIAEVDRASARVLSVRPTTTPSRSWAAACMSRGRRAWEATRWNAHGRGSARSRGHHGSRPLDRIRGCRRNRHSLAPRRLGKASSAVV